MEALNVKGVLDLRHAGNAYRIAVYQNLQCTIDAIAYSGNATGCTNGFGSGWVGIQLLALDADGQLVYYNHVKRPANAEVAVFNPSRPAHQMILGA